MKKLVVLGLAAVMALGAPFSVCAAEEETTVEHPSGLKIGCAVQTMSNQVWAQQMEEITKDAKEDGNEVTVVECKENANTQIDQIENFITSGMDVIIVQPVDPDAIEEVCKEALDSDIEVVCWDEKMENSSFNWVIENYDLGVEIGTQAADFINEKFGDKGCEVVVLGYPQTPILLERENGILDALKEKAPNAEVVANQPAIDTTEGLNAMETILQSHPDVKVVCCIGGGGATGANEALKGTYGSEVPDDIGIFSTDLTDEAIATAKSSDAVLMGSIGGDAKTSPWYKLEPSKRPEAGLLAIRKALNLFANLRPAYLYNELRKACPLRDEIIGDGFDMIIVRELTGGLYFGERQTIEENGVKKAIDTLSYNENEIRRIAIKAFEIARKRRNKVTSVDKANVLDSSRLWRKVVEEVAKDYPDVTLEHMLVDNCAMQLVRDPKQFDVILTENMFGDILSDEASMVTGFICKLK